MADTDTLAPPDTKTKPRPDAGPPPINYDRVGQALGLSDDRRVAEDQRRVDEAKSNLAVPQMTPLPQPAPPTDPFQAFGQPAMIVALLGGLLTRRPLASAIQSGGAVLQATAAKDAALAKQKFDEWKIQSENGFKMAHFTLEQLNSALKEQDTDQKGGVARTNILLSSMKLDALRQIRDTEGEDAYQRALLHLSNKVGTAEDAAKKFEIEHGPAIAEQTLTDANLARQAQEAGHKLTPQQQKALDNEGWAKEFLKVHKETAEKGSAAAKAEADADAVAAVTLKKQRGETVTPEEQNAADEAQARINARMNVKAATSAATSAAKAAPPGPERDVQLVSLVASKKARGEEPTPEEQRAADDALARQHARLGVVTDHTKAAAQARADVAKESEQVLNPGALELFARNYLMTGQMPYLGMGAQNSVKIQIANKADEIAQAEGHTAQDYIAGRATLKADSSSLTKITSIADAVNGFEQTMLKNMKIAESLMDKGAGTSLGPVVNRWIQGGKAGTGDRDVAAFNIAMGTVASEYGKIISGGSASIASTPEGAREEAKEWLDKIQSPDAINAQFAVARQDTTNRKTSLDDQRAIIQRRIQGGISSETPAEGTPTREAVAPKPHMSDDQIIAAAKKRIADHPEQKAAITARLKSWGLDAGGL